MSSTIVVPTLAHLSNFPPEIAVSLVSVATAAAADIAALQAGETAETPQSRTLTAGTGLTGGGDLTANRTFNVVGNADGSILANADDVQVGILATDAQHGNRGGGGIHALATTGVAGFLSAADKVKVNSIQTGTATLVLGTATVSTATLTAGSKVYLTLNTPIGGAQGAGYSAPGASVTPGAPGSFVINAVSTAGVVVTTDVSTVNWLVVG